MSRRDDVAAQGRGSMKAGPSEDYLALLRGEIRSEEYLERLKATVDERLERRASAAQGRDWMKLLVWFGPAAFVALGFLIGWLAS